MLLFLEEAAPPTADTGAAGMLMTFLPLIAISAVFLLAVNLLEARQRRAGKGGGR